MRKCRKKSAATARNRAKKKDDLAMLMQFATERMHLDRETACWYTPAVTILRAVKAFREWRGEEQHWGPDPFDALKGMEQNGDTSRT